MAAPAEVRTSSSSWTLGEVARLSGGTLLGGEATSRFGYRAISTDTRSIRKGDFFVALRGDNHDGHRHLGSAEESGAIGALVDHAAERTLPQIRVEDSLGGWQRWSENHRNQWTGERVVGVTGSSGKTTVKDILAHLLGGIVGSESVWATEGNRNNHIGVPWTLLGLDPDHRFAVIEMGMNHPGEIELLTGLARPDVAVITSVGRAHIGHMRSRQAILDAKLEIVRGLPAGGPLVLPHDPWIAERLPQAVADHPITTFGWGEEADWHPRGAVELRLDGSRFATDKTGPIELSLLGRGAVLSTLAALATLDALGLDVLEFVPMLANVDRHQMRMEPRTRGEVIWLLDCYNASPESTALAIEFLDAVEHPGRKILVLGELAELGDQAEAIHRELGQQVQGVDVALFVGPDTKQAHEAATKNPGVGLSTWKATREDASTWLDSGLRPGDLVLLKAARRLALERILERPTLGDTTGAGN